MMNCSDPNCQITEPHAHVGQGNFTMCTADAKMALTAEQLQIQSLESRLQTIASREDTLTKLSDQRARAVVELASRLSAKEQEFDCNERMAVMRAHRMAGSAEHDPVNGKIHGYCVVCLLPWPCEYADDKRVPKYQLQITELEKELAARDAQLKEDDDTIYKLEQRAERAEEALKWIATVNSVIDLRKQEPKTLIGLIYELRAKARETLGPTGSPKDGQ